MKTDKLPSIIQKLLAYRRRSRVDFMLSKVSIKTDMNVVDIGCGIDGRSFEDYVPDSWKITGIDIQPPECARHSHLNFAYVQRDAQDLSCYKNHEFDLAISIGMLEHVTDEQAFRRIVSEIRRVAKQYIVVVPYKYCWIEPHYGIPFFPLLPYWLKLALVKSLNLSGHRDVVKQNREYIRENYRWLSNTEYLVEFPDSKIFLLPTRETIAIIRYCK